MNPKEILDLLILISICGAVLGLFLGTAYTYLEHELLLHFSTTTLAISSSFAIIVILIKFLGGV